MTNEAEARQEEVKLNLYQKISAVMQDVEYLQKDDHISFGKTNYRAISEEKVTLAVRKALIKYGLVIIPVEQDYQRNGNIGIVQVKYKIIDIDTGEHEIITSIGEGADTQDKASGKSLTYSYKYLLLRTFAIPTGEDPDKISSEELDQRQAKHAQNDQRASLETETNNMIMSLIQGGYDANQLHQVCSQAIRPFNQVSELNQNELYKLKELLQGQMQPAR